MSGTRWTREEDAYVMSHPEDTGMQLRDGLNGSHGNQPETYMLRRQRLNRYGAENFSNATEESRDRIEKLGRISKLLDDNGITVEDIGAIEKVRLNSYEGFYKDSDGEAHKVEMNAASLILTPSWETGPRWPVVQPVQLPPIGTPLRSMRDAVRGRKVAAIITDLQIGYYRTPQATLEPTHDERAISIMLQVIKDSQPDRIILIGDSMDLSEMSRYRKEPAWAMTTQASLDRMVRLLIEIQHLLLGESDIEWIEGNHEVRMSNWVKDNASASFGLRPGGAPDHWPVLSLPTLCRLDELGVKYHSGYPAVKVWLNDRLKVEHGDKVGKGVVSSYLDEERASTIFGHIHRRVWEERTRETRYGPRTILAACPGCMCRIDGAVPSTKSGLDVQGQPVEHYENWQQGFAMVEYDEINGAFSYEPVAIHEQMAMWRGELYHASRDLMGEDIVDREDDNAA